MDLVSLAIIGGGAAAGSAVYQMKLKRGDFDDAGRLKKIAAQFVAMTVLMGIPSCGYQAWKLRGFQPIDAHDAETTMEQRYLKEGAAQTEAHFIVTGHSSMSGYVNVTMPDGARQVLTCKAEKGETDEYLITCLP